MEVFEVSNQPLWVGPAPSGWLPTFFGWLIMFGWCYPTLGLGWPTKKGLSSPIEARLHILRVVTDLKNVYENVNFYFHSTSMFVKYLGIRII